MKSKFWIVALVFFATLAVAAIPAALAKGTEDKPVTVLIGEEGNNVDVKIDPAGNNVDANVTNEVEIKNNVGDPIAVDTGNMIRTPFAVLLTDGTFGTSFNERFTVADGMILVIETVSADLQVTGNGPRAAELVLTTGGVDQRVSLNVHTQPGLGGSSRHHSINHSLRLYADPGSDVVFFAIAESGETLIGNATLSGYLIADDDPSLAP